MLRGKERDTSMKNNDRIDELRTVVLQVGNAPARSERRTARLERTIRWGALTLMLLLVLGLATAFQPFGFALAQQEARTPSKSAEEAIDRLTESLTGQRSTLGMKGEKIEPLAVSAV